MIIKSISGCGFRNICFYVAGDPSRSEILLSNYVREWDIGLMVADFNIVASLRPSLNNNMYHAIISFPKTEKPENEMLSKIAEEYMNKLGFKKAPYVVVKHFEKEHIHLHIVSSFLTIDNVIVNRGYIGLRSRDIARQLEKQFGLQTLQKKDLTKTNFKSLKGSDLERYKLFVIISNALKYSKNFDQFKDFLSKNKVDLKLKFKGETGEVQGISFKFKNSLNLYKGSDVDRNFSYFKLIQSISLNVPHQVNYSVEQKSETKGSVISDFLNAFGGGSAYSGGIFPTHTPSHNPDTDDEEEKKKKKKKKRRSNEYNI